MAILKANDGFEIELCLNLGIQQHDYGLSITIKKDGKPYLIPESKNEHCDPIDYENYRMMDYEYHGSDKIFTTIREYALNIKKNNLKHAFGFCCWPDEYITMSFSNDEKSDIVSVKIVYDYWALDEIKFKEFGIIDGNFSFTTTKNDFIKFYEDLENEFSIEKNPKRVLLKSEDASEEPFEDEKKIIKKQKRIDTDNPVIIIDEELFSLKKQKGNYEAIIKELSNSYYIVIFCKSKNTDIFNDNEKIIKLKKKYYPKNEQIIYLRDERSSLSIYCCLDRYITSIWFSDCCKKDWNIALQKIQNCIKNPPPLTDLSNDDGTCTYALF